MKKGLFLFVLRELFLKAIFIWFFLAF